MRFLFPCFESRFSFAMIRSWISSLAAQKPPEFLEQIEVSGIVLGEGVEEGGQEGIQGSSRFVESATDVLQWDERSFLLAITQHTQVVLHVFLDEGV